ncbi:MAG: hypothetical protein ACI4E1_08230 [Lachnospira sp.]
MRLYQIIETAAKSNTAGSKAVDDIIDISNGMGFEKVYIVNNEMNQSLLSKCRRQMNCLLEWNKAYKAIEDGSVVLLQHPFHRRQIGRKHTLIKLKRKKNVKFISVIHDVEALRKIMNDSYHQKEFSMMLQAADILIVHNDSMAKWFTDIGVSADKIVVLNIFDYLHNNKNNIMQKPAFEKKIIIAGNLDVNKSQYIGQLEQLEKVAVQLYGPNFNTEMLQYSNISYGGSLPPDEVPQVLTSGFGLVWDGNSIEKCSGNTGEYLRYNNPHKLSLYLSSGLPVVIWKEAAEAEFVVKNNVGIVVNSLKELSSVFEGITEEDYNAMANNVEKIADKLRNGEYTKTALNKAIKQIS